LKIAESSTVREDLDLDGKDYAVLTLHRPSNVDEKEIFSGLLEALCEISEKLPIIFPAHPRTRTRISEFGFTEKIKNSNLQLVEPFGYLDFMRLYSGARLVFTDSGGLQEETTALSIPCLTLRENTERPITISMGTNILVGVNPEKIRQSAFEVLNRENSARDKKIPPLWDGRAAERICDELVKTR
jgi:UDP-N-acetylglucosamine 2-epimerase (non-hydrolysing)